MGKVLAIICIMIIIETGNNVQRVRDSALGQQKESFLELAGPFVILSILFSIPFISIFRPPRAFLLAELLSYSKIQLDIYMYVCVLTILLNGFLTFVTTQVVYF